MMDYVLVSVSQTTVSLRSNRDGRRGHRHIFPAKTKRRQCYVSVLTPFLPEDDIDLMILVLSSLSGLLTDEAALTYGLEKSKYSDS